MPYERKGKCVYKADTGKLLKCFQTTQEAKDYIMALHANVKDAVKATKNKWGK